MYENILLESGKVFRGSRISGVGGKVVDDEQNITITAAGHGMADIVNVDAPDVFVPDVQSTMHVTLKNIGSFAERLYVKLTNVDTGEVLKDFTSFDPVLPGNLYTQEMFILLSQITDFHGLIEAGHVEP